MREEPLTNKELTERIADALIGLGGSRDAQVVAADVRDGIYVDVMFADDEEAIISVYPA